MPPRLSLVMIVRDEAEFLPRFLSHAQGVWDELCVVDTGSTDGTVSLLERAGARVQSVRWQEDFALARNASLAMATGDWVLFLDPDEFLSEEARRGIRSVLMQPDAGAATVRMRNALPSGTHRDARLLRMFLREPEIQFRHRIHEDVTESVLAMLGRTGKRLVSIDGIVHHEGYVRARAVTKDKKARDARLLQSALKERPEDLYLHFKLLEQARFWSDRALWKQAADGAAGAVERAGSGLRRAHFGGELLALIADGRFPGANEASKALEWLKPRFERAGPSAPLTLRRAELREHCGDLAGAKADFERCLTLTDVSGNISVTHVRPKLGLARLALAGGRLEEARGFVREALALAPLDAEALLASVALHAALGKDALDGFRADYVTRHGESAELWNALGEHAVLTGRLTDAEAALARAVTEREDAASAALLPKVLLALGKTEEARWRCEALASRMPEAMLGVVLCDLFEGKPSDVELELEPEEAQSAMRRWVEPFRHSPPAVKVRLASVAPALGEPFPWLPAWSARLCAPGA